MVYWFESVLLYITSCLVHSYAVDPTCECVVYQSYGLSSGRFYSPNYPEPYRHGINCILYTFIGDVNEIVEIDFIDMDLKKRVEISPTYYQCKDFIKVFKNLDRPEVNEKSRSDDELCGNISELPQKKFYSQGRGLILEFHTDKESRETHSGFRGVFRFLDRSTFRTDGTLQLGSRCSYNMQSFNNNTRGDFYSPRYPQNYPNMANCHYMFHGHSSEKVNVTFKVVRLPHRGHRGCENSGDKITVYDGRDNTSKLLAVYCETQHNPKPLFSSGPYMYIEFKSDRHNQLQGFAAEFSFVNSKDWIRDQSTIGPNGTNGDIKTSKAKLKPEVLHIANTLGYYSKLKSIENNVQKCTQVIESRNGDISGSITSPDYPNDYPSSMVCKYTFKGEGQERVQIRFLDMDLHYTGRGAPSDPFQCSDEGDTITVIIYINDERKELGEYCGQKKPPVLMSNGVKMEVVFKSDSKMKSGVSGFKFEYTFRTDFGVQGNGVQDSRKVCTFKFRSRLHSHGTFTSPNFGGLYPRDTECRFIFNGRKNERVQIHFDDFDVDGIRPSCTNNDESDSVSFSNYLNSEDRKMPRYCGLSLPGMVQSDSSFFVVTFRSNEVFDAKGFKAIYNFISSEENDDVEPQPTTQDDNNHACRLAATTTLMTSLSCVFVFLILKL